MPRIVLATGNPGKVKEFAEMLPPPHWDLIGLKDLGFLQDIPETGMTFRENALIKAQALAQVTDMPVLSDDSGLMVAALNGAPGVHTARYAGEGATSEANRRKLLTELTVAGALNILDRRAAFICVLCWLAPGEEPRFFEGRCEGHIVSQPSGNGGFGYDSLFQPVGEIKTFAELPAHVKHGRSHRGAAIQALLNFMA